MHCSTLIWQAQHILKQWPLEQHNTAQVGTSVPATRLQLVCTHTLDDSQLHSHAEQQNATPSGGLARVCCVSRCLFSPTHFNET